MIVVMGASGNTGRIVAERLLDKGEAVRVLGRSAEKLQDLAARGAEVLTGDAEDEQFLKKAFAGAEAVYTLLPPDVQSADVRGKQDRVGEATVSALRAAGVKRVVFLSSVGAQHPTGTGPIAGLHAHENRLRQLEGVDVLSLRPGAFFENHFGTLGLIKYQGINGGGIAGDIPVSMIATRDIGEAAAAALLARDFQGFVTRELLGPRNLTHNEVTRILGEKIGKPDLAYVQFPIEGFVAGLQQAGLGADISRLYGEMAEGVNAGLVRAEEPRSAQNTTPTRFEDFAEGLAHAYRAL